MPDEKTAPEVVTITGAFRYTGKYVAVFCSFVDTAFPR